MATPLGQAYVEIIPDTKGFGSETEKALDKELAGVGEKAGRQIGDGIGGALKKLGTVVAAAGIGSFFKSAIDAAGDLNEQVSKTEVVFGDAADEVLAFGKHAATSIGASEKEALTATGTFGNLLRSVGLSSDAAADMSVEMVQLAGDLASFNNVPVADALAAIQSGLVGEMEPLKRFGVNLNDATLKAEALKLGLDQHGPTLDAASKAQAAYSAIMKQTSLAQGDFARTSDSLANQQRILSAEFQNAKAEIGQALLPAMLTMVQAGRDLVPALTGVGTSLGHLGTGAATALGPVLDLVGAFVNSDVGQFAITAGLAAVAVSKVSDAATAAATAMKTFGTGLSAGLSTAQLAIGGIGIGVGLLVTLLGNMAEANAQARERQQELAKEMEKAGFPAATLAEGYTKLAASADKVAESEGAAADQTGNLSEAWVRNRLVGDDVLATLNAFGVGTEQVFAAVTGDVQAYQDILARLAPQATAFGVVHNDAMDKARDSVIRLRSDAGGAIDIFGDKVRQALQKLADTDPAIKAQLGVAEAQATATDEGERWLEIGRAMAAQNPEIAAGFDAIAAGREADTALMSEQTAAAQQLEAARGRLAATDQKAADAAADAAVKYGLSLENGLALVEANDRLEDATKRHSDAEKELADALDEARQAQEKYLFVTGGAQVQVDDVTTAVRDMTKGLSEGAEATGRGTVAFEGNTDQAIKNRDALQDVFERAQTVINGYDDLGYSSEQATAHQAELAQSMYDTAIQAGATEEEAARLRDGILQIPAERNTKVDVAAQGVAETSAEIDHAARDREATISVGLKAVGISDELLQAVRTGKLTYAAEGGLFHHRPGGHLAVIGEGSEDEAVVPLGRNFAENLARVVGPKRMAELQGGVTNNVSVTIANAPNGRAEAERMGRLLGESAADVLARRQMATIVKAV